MKKLLLVCAGSMFLFSCCAKAPHDLMRPNAATLKIRETQSRQFDVQSDKQLLQASVSVLQDMGYTIKESSSDYGVLTATKEASAVSPGQVVGAIATALICGQATPIDKTQHITVTLVVLDKCGDDKASARTTFERIIVKTDNSQYAETVTDQQVYSEFYEKLEKALFLEVNNI